MQSVSWSYAKILLPDMRLLSGKFLIYCNDFVINFLNYYLHGKEILFFSFFFQIKNQKLSFCFLFLLSNKFYIYIFSLFLLHSTEHWKMPHDAYIWCWFYHKSHKYRYIFSYTIYFFLFWTKQLNKTQIFILRISEY